MQICQLILAIFLQAVCKGQEICEVFPSNQVIKYGSELMVFLRAPPNSDCRKKSGFPLSSVYWTLDGRNISEYSYSNSTSASVLIPSFSLSQGTVECHVDGIVLGGTVIRTYSFPQNISCIAKMDFVEVSFIVTCTWHHDQHNIATSYTVYMKQNTSNVSCHTLTKSCTFSDENTLLDQRIAITVIAINSAGLARSEEVTYKDLWEIVKADTPTDVKVKSSGLTGLFVSWSNTQQMCEVQFSGKGTKSVETDSGNSLELTGLKSCTNYTVSVRCRIHAVWSEWSHNVTHLTPINVSSVEFQLWRSKGVLKDMQRRTIHLMWKGILPSCKAFDEYRLFDKALNFVKNFKPSENHTFIDIDQNKHRISLAAFRNNKSIREVSIEIPSMAEDLNLPPVGNVSMIVRDGQIHMTWEKPNLTVSGYIIVWNSTEEDHKWQQTQATHFTSKGEDFKLYTISLIPLYEKGPGSEIRRHYYIKEGDPAAVSKVQVENIRDRNAEISWLPVLPTQCCAFVESYTVFFKAQNDPTFKNLTVDLNQHSVTLDSLLPSTTYLAFIRANSMAASSESGHITFTTMLNSNSLFVLIACGVALMLGLLCMLLLVMMRREYLTAKVPNPQLSSLSMWSAQKCKNHWSQLPTPWDCDSEKFLACQVETEGRISAMHSPDMANLMTCTPEQNTTIQETAETENNVLVSSSPKRELASDEQEKAPALLALTLKMPQIHPVIPKSPYRNQTPLPSPVDSPRTLLKGTTEHQSSEETSLLKPELYDMNLSTTYVTVDLLKQKSQSI